MPPWADEDGRIQENIRDPKMREAILSEMRNPSGDWEDLGSINGPEAVLLAQFHKPESRQFQGKTLAEGVKGRRLAARRRSRSPSSVSIHEGS